MKKPSLFNKNANAIALSLLLLAAPRLVVAADAAAPAPGNPYSSVQTVVLDDGTHLDIMIANSPITPPQPEMAIQEAAFSTVAAVGDVMIAEVPKFDLSYGSSATAGAMIAGYYDRTGYPDMYTGPTNGGIMPLTNTSWGVNQCPLSATKNGLDGRTTRGHVDDYYVDIEDEGPDPYEVNGWTEHTIGDCTGDYMKTSKWLPKASTDHPTIITEAINKDGAAVFIFDATGPRLTSGTLKTYGLDLYDAGYGLKLFFESRGYTVSTMYNQYIAPFKAGGFTYTQYKAEIDAGRPVMLHLSGHVVVGIGYNNTNQKIIFHDSWDNTGYKTMTWGGIYNNEAFTHTAVTIVTLAKVSQAKFPWTMFLPAIINSK